ncbi:MAG: hypothetical protein U5K75_03850 [Ahrensia sp.]|nr:hypothetical protein [Ahrensia sp.]
MSSAVKIEAITSSDDGDGIMRAADGTPLKARLAKALRREKLRSFLMIAPLLLFVVVTFLLPIGDMLFRSVENQIVQNTIPNTVVALKDWDPKSGEIPSEEVFAALGTDMTQAFKDKTHTKLGLRLNYDNPGMSGLFRKTGPATRTIKAPFREAFLKVDPAWGTVETWATIRGAAPAYTDGYFLNALDLQRTANGIEQVPESNQIYVQLFQRTLFMSLVITFSCLLSGLSGCVSDGAFKRATSQHALDPRAAAVLDVAAGAHLRMESAAADARRHQ